MVLLKNQSAQCVIFCNTAQQSGDGIEKRKQWGDHDWGSVRWPWWKNTRAWALGDNGKSVFQGMVGLRI